MKKLWDVVGFVLLMAVLMFFSGWLSGCADSSTRSGDDKDIEVTINIENEGNGKVYLNPDLGELVVTANEATDQETENEAEVSPDTSAAFAQEGGTSSAALDGAKSLLEGITSSKEADKKVNSDNPIDNSDHSDRSDNRKINQPDEPPPVEEGEHHG